VPTRNPSTTPPKGTLTESTVIAEKGGRLLQTFLSSAQDHLSLTTTDDYIPDYPNDATNSQTNIEINTFLTEQKKIFLDDTIYIGTHNIRGINRTID
jgi:hypothetical protein